MYFKYFVFVILCMVLCHSCDPFSKEIEIETADFPPKLSVTATLDTDSGTFTLFVFEGRSVAYHENTPSDLEIIRDGEIRLYGDGEQIFSLQGPFTLSFGRGFRHVAKGISVKAGCSYRLEIDIEGYDMVTSTALMPDAPIIGEVRTDTVHTVYKAKGTVFYNFENSFTFSAKDSAARNLQYYVTRLSLTDNSNGTDYYSFQRIFSYTYADGTILNLERDIGISDINLIQDNPEYYYNRNLLEDEVCDIYEYDLMVLSDCAFAGRTVHLELLTNDPHDISPSGSLSDLPIPDYDPDRDGTEVKSYYANTLIVKHISTETFLHYRSLVCQKAGVDFFTEPAYIVSNVENGYGCFAAVNTQRIHLYDYVKYAYYHSPWE